MTFFFPQKGAISFSWDLLTRVFHLPKDRLYVTYFGGCKEANLEPDEEAKQLWLDIGYVIRASFGGGGGGGGRLA